MKPPRRLVLLLVPLLLAACHGRTQFYVTPTAPEAAPRAAPERTVEQDLPAIDQKQPTGRVPEARPVAGPPSPPPRRGGRVFLSDRDLAPVDAFLHWKNAQWILGDEVEVVASREYFAQNLTVNETLGTVRRRETTRADETVVELTYLGAPGTAGITTSPRILIGTGLTITARRKMVLRLVKTTSPVVPLSLRITAKGNASRGRGDEVWIREPVLNLGGQIRRQQNRWIWYPIG